MRLFMLARRIGFVAALLISGSLLAKGDDLLGMDVSTDIDQVLARMPVERRYVFGAASQPAAAADVAIRSMADLAREFEPFQTWTGRVSIGSEFERYQDWNPGNHVLEADRLTLAATLDRSQWKASYATVFGELGWIGTRLDGSVPIDRLGLQTTQGIEPGRIALFQGRGAFVVDGIEPNESLRFRPLVDASLDRVRNGLVAFLPAYALRLAEDARPGGANETMLRFDTMPDGLEAGSMVGWSDGRMALQRNGDYRISAIDRSAKTVTVRGRLPARKAGDVMVFTPPIASGQIWSRLGLDLGRRSYAVDFRVVLPGSDGGDTDTAGIADREAMGRVPGTYPWGAWPALWLYGKNQGGGVSVGDEIDVFEGYYDTYRGPHAFSGNNHGGGPNETLYYKDDGDWSAIDPVNRRNARSLSGERRFTVVVTPDRTLRFVDGELIKVDRYSWRNPRPAEIGVNLAIGSLDTSGSANLLAPLAESNFAGMRFSIRSMTIHAAR